MSAPQRIGKYEIQSLLGKGAASAVYRGSDGKRSVALKVVGRSAIKPPALLQLRQAAPALASLQHPAIAAFVDLVESEKAICVVTEPVEGEPLSAIIKEGAPSNLRQAWDISRQLLDALAAAHAHSILHLNLKPANLFVDGKGNLKVADFAVTDLATDGEATPHYMAPEQFGHGEVGMRTDFYQVGAIVYQLLTGRTPFSGTRDEVAHRVMQERPSDPSSFSPKVAWQLDWVVQRALSKDPAERFGSAREFLEGLRLGFQETLGTPLALPAAPPPPAPAPVKKAAPSPAPATVKPLDAGVLAKIREASQAALAAKPAPPAPPAPAKAPAAKVPAAEAPRIRVLFVDDDERILNALSALFRGTYDVLTASGGTAALEMLKQHGPHVIVSDQRMPGMTGAELLREVRKEAPRTVRLLLTGYSDLAALVGAVNEGEIFRFVKKPWDNDEIRTMLAEAAAVAAKLAAAEQPKAQSPRSAGSLLVLDASEGLAKGLQRLLSGTATVHLAHSPRDAAKILQEQDVAAVVADLTAGKDGVIALLKFLKAKRPETLSILVADEADSELVADLVNQAQIYRFLPRPVDARELRGAVSDALRSYGVFKESLERARLELAKGVAQPDRLVPSPG